MKKLIIASIITSFVALSTYAATITTVLNPGVFTNILMPYNGSARLTQLVISANGTNAAATIIDTYTNALSYTNSAYTNFTSYATNYVTTWTNYYGATNSITNIALVDITNSVAGTTNNFPTRITTATLASTTTTIGNVNYYFQNGAWATNTSSGVATITATFTAP